MKLWIDDIRTPPDDSWHICRNVSAAIRALDMFWNEVSEINLDHDISHQVVMAGTSRTYPCDETFEAVARYLACLKGQDGAAPWHPTIKIHTSNRVGAVRMRDILNEAGFQNVESVVAPGANRLETIL